MRTIRMAATVSVVVLAIAAIVSYVVQFNRIEHTTSLLAGGAVVISLLLVGTRNRGDSGR